MTAGRALTLAGTIEEPRDLATIPEDDFQRALERIEIGKKRMAQILDSYLVEGAHYGNPLTSSGRPVFKKPILYRAGAEDLRKAFRLELRTERDEVVVETAEYVSVTVYFFICDMSGRVLDRKSASCTTKEKRFKRTDGQGFIYEDARECLNDCRAMAEKRADVRATCGALGVTAFLAAEEEMEKDLADGENGEPKAAKPKPANGNGGAAMRFGRDKGKPLAEISDKDLDSSIAWCDKTDPAKFKTAIEEMTAEVSRRAQPKAAPAQASGELPLGVEVERKAPNAVREGR